MLKITYNILKTAQFQPKQNEALNVLFNLECKYLLYGGAAGGGKSYFLRWLALFLGFYYFKKYNIRGVPIGLFSEDYPTLKDRQISRIKREFPSFLGRLVESRDEGYIFEVDEDYGGSRILLRNLDDPSKYMSAEFAAILVEELTRNSVETFEDLRFRLRYPGINDVKFVGTTNPGGVGHSWVKKLWIEPDPKFPDKEAKRFKFVPATVKDNRFISNEYVLQLESLPEQKRKAWLEGSWDIFEGQYFSEFNRDHHVIEPFEIDSMWKRYIGLDWGVNKPFAVIWMAEDYDGNMYVYRELYMNGMDFEAQFGKPLTPRRLARIILSINKKANENYMYCVCDPSIWNQAYFGKGAKALEGGESIAEVMSHEGMKLIKGDNDRINGAGKFRDSLSISPSGTPWLRFFKNCYHSNRTIPSLIYDKHRVEDVDTDGEDHIYDAIRYILMSRPTKTHRLEKPKEVNLIKKQLLIARRRYEQNQSQGEYEW